MQSQVFCFSLMLIAATHFFLFGLQVAAGQPRGHKHHYHLFGLAGQDGHLTTTTLVPTIVTRALPSLTGSAMPCSAKACASATAQPTSLPCDAANGTAYSPGSNMTNFTLICDIDFPGQNIYPFVLAGSFDECLTQCEDYNLDNNTDTRCAGFVFAPERVNDTDDCYLKSSLNEPASATIHLIGATIALSTAPSTSPATSGGGGAAVPDHQPGSASAPWQTPSVLDVKFLGSSSNKPTNQYISHPMAFPEKLASTLLVPGINLDLINDYPLAGDTGTWTSTSILRHNLADMSITPHLSRDGGKGGTINGSHLFVFCDTANYNDSQMLGFVSSSVAVDSGMGGLSDQALMLVDEIGQWQDDVGRLRGFAPMTTGGEAFNIALSGQGYRYAIWPESSLIPLNSTHSLLYAALVYDKVDMSTQAANFTELGNTLLVVSVDPHYGPNAQRLVNQLFCQDEVDFGTLGGIRAWGESGIGGTDGSIYLFGRANHGVLMAKTTPSSFTNRSFYTFWDGQSWSTNMPAADSSNLMFNEQVMDFDVVYSPHHRTFVMVYLTPNADNTFYYRWLEPGCSSCAIVPPYEDGGDPNYVENLVLKKWSDEHVLARIEEPAMGYVYAGGLHAGYFGADDITEGGQKVLLSWTEHTGQDASSSVSGYAHKTAVITFQDIPANSSNF